MMRGTTLEPLCARRSTERTWRGRTRGAGERGINVRSRYTGSSNKLEDAQKQTPTQVPRVKEMGEGRRYEISGD